MLTDYHCHILPKIDDGSQSVMMSLEMIRLMRDQGVERIVATPHFYARKEESVESYLEKRRRAYERLTDAAPEEVSDILLGAEVAIEHGLSKIGDLDKLCYQGTRYLLLELPYAPFGHWMVEEIADVCIEYDVVPVIAHLNRYLDYYSKAELEKILSIDAVFQFNNEAFGNWGQRKFVKGLIRDGYPYIFGSDAHNMSSRRPNWDLMHKKAKEPILEGAESLF